MKSVNFIDHEEMVPFEGPLVQNYDVVEGFSLKSLDLDFYTTRRFSFVEQIIELNGSLVQIMKNPVKFKLLNLDSSAETFENCCAKTVLMSYTFDLS